MGKSDYGEYGESALLWQLAITERALGSEHPSVATSLEEYAALLYKKGRDDEAAEMEARARAIRAKHTHPKEAL